MPYYPPKRALKRGIDLAWDQTQITASVTGSILQGKSIKGMSDDLQKRITTMNRDSAIRTARTAVTGAQNAGRMESYAAAKKMGIKLKKEWFATLDSRTRREGAEVYWPLPSRKHRRWQIAIPARRRLRFKTRNNQ